MADLYIKVDEHGQIVGQPEAREIHDWSEVALNHDGSYSIRKIIDEPPVFDSNTERLINTGYTITAENAIVQYAIQAIDSKELADRAYAAAIAAGFPVPNTNWRIRLYEKDQATMSGAMSLILGGLQSGQLQLTSPTFLIDSNDIRRDMTVAEALGIILQYGFYVINLKNIVIAPPPPA